MRAVVEDTYGSAEVLRLARITRPHFADNEVLVRVHAAGLDRGTWHLMTGRPYLLRLAAGLRRPRNPVPKDGQTPSTSALRYRRRSLIVCATVIW